MLSEALFPPLPYTEEVGEVGTVVVVVLVSLSDASQQGRALPSLLPHHLTRPPRGSGVSPVEQRLTTPGKGYRERGLRGAERTGEMVRTGATPSPETDGEPRKTLRPREEIGRGGGAAPVRPPGTQAQEARTTGGPASAPWWKRTGGWTGRGLRAWAGGAAPGGLGRGGGGPGGGRETSTRTARGQADSAWERRTRQEGVGTDERAEAPREIPKDRTDPRWG